MKQLIEAADLVKCAEGSVEEYLINELIELEVEEYRKYIKYLDDDCQELVANLLTKYLETQDHELMKEIEFEFSPEINKFVATLVERKRQELLAKETNQLEVKNLCIFVSVVVGISIVALVCCCFYIANKLDNWYERQKDFQRFWYEASEDIGSNYEIYMHPTYRADQFMIERNTGRIWRLVKNSNNSFLWEEMDTYPSPVEERNFDNAVANNDIFLLKDPKTDWIFYVNDINSMRTYLKNGYELVSYSEYKSRHISYFNISNSQPKLKKEMK